MPTDADWWDRYKEEPTHKPGFSSMDIECEGNMQMPIGFVKLRERVRVKAIGIRWEILN